MVLVTAEAGGGKTALIERFCAAQSGSARVLRGACDALFTPRPLGPIQDVAVEVGPALTDLLLREATPYQVAAAMSRSCAGASRRCSWSRTSTGRTKPRWTCSG